MPRSHIALARRCAALLLALSSAAGAQTPLGTGFTYQGRLTSAGQPVNGTANLVFSLYDAPTAGTLLGTQTLSNATVTNGLFTVILDAAGELGSAAFDGNKHWLEISVNGITLTTRLEITPVPYSSLARGVIFPLSGSTALSTPAISVTNSNAAGIALSGRVTSPTGITQALVGQTDSTAGYGVVGVANATSGTNFGVYGRSASVSGYGVYGEATTTTAGSRTYGVYGRATADIGIGVTGE